MAAVTPGPDASRRPRLLGELAIGLATFAVYLAVAASGGPARDGVARANAENLLRLEQALHLDLERPVNAWLTRHPTIATLANDQYATGYVLVAFGLILWLYLRRPDLYRPARTSFVLLNLLAIVVFAVHPMTPPRYLSGHGFVDTVTLGGTWGPWESVVVDVANPVAAMPSLHVAWVLWVSLVLARIPASRRVQLLSAANVLVTSWVVIATGNHWVLDVVGAVLVVLPCLLVLPPARAVAGIAIAAADAFFLAVDSPRYPHQLGGVAAFAPRPGVDALTAEAVATLARRHIDALPRFRQRPSEGPRWRRPRWVDHPGLDWAWHVCEVVVDDGTGGGFEAGLDRLVAGLVQTPLPRDRPLWRLVVVRDRRGGRSALVLLVHHAIADGVGTIEQGLRLLGVAPEEPAEPVPGSAPDGPGHGVAPRPGVSAGRLLVGLAVGLAQLATDGRAASWPQTRGRTASHAPLPRTFARFDLPLADVRAAARAGDVRVTDVLLHAVATALAVLRPSGMPPSVRVAVPLMLRRPGSGSAGNVTAAVQVDLPVGSMPAARRLGTIAAQDRRLRRSHRVPAARFVVATLTRVLPGPVHRWFVRTVYGWRFFLAVVTNIPGPAHRPHLAGRRLETAFPVVPIAPGTGLAVGAMGWGDRLCVAVSAAEVAGLSADALCLAMRRAIEDLVPDNVPGPTAQDRPLSADPG